MYKQQRNRNGDNGRHGSCVSHQVVYFTSTFPYLMMTVMIIRGATLPGAIDGIVYYLKPDFNRLTDAKVSPAHLIRQIHTGKIVRFGRITFCSIA